MDEIIGGIVSGAGAGPLGLISGLLGGFVSKLFGWLEVGRKIQLAEINNKHQLQMAKMDSEHELAMADKRLQSQLSQQESEERITSTNAASANLSSSYRHDTGYGEVYKWAATALRLVRPLLTVMLIWMTWEVFKMVEQAGRLEDVSRMVDGVLYTTTAAISWWFADRGASGNPFKSK